MSLSIRGPDFSLAPAGEKGLAQKGTEIRPVFFPNGPRGAGASPPWSAAAEERFRAGIDKDIRPFYCRMCQQCSGQCPKGVAIPDTIRYLSYADFYGQFAQIGRANV